jgi:hypothetical protein
VQEVRAGRNNPAIASSPATGTVQGQAPTGGGNTSQLSAAEQTSSVLGSAVAGWTGARGVLVKLLCHRVVDPLGVGEAAAHVRTRDDHGIRELLEMALRGSVCRWSPSLSRARTPRRTSVAATSAPAHTPPERSVGPRPRKPRSTTDLAARRTGVTPGYTTSGRCKVRGSGRAGTRQRAASFETEPRTCAGGFDRRRSTDDAKACRTVRWVRQQAGVRCPLTSRALPRTCGAPGRLRSGPSMY